MDTKHKAGAGLAILLLILSVLVDFKFFILSLLVDGVFIGGALAIVWWLSKSKKEQDEL